MLLCNLEELNSGGTKEVKFGDGKKVKVKPQIAQRVMSKMMTL